MTIKAAFLLLWPVALSAEYSGLIAARDGSAVTFQYRNSFTVGAWYRWTANAVAPHTAIPTPDGKVTWAAGYSERRCSAAGSTCFLAAPCSAGWRIETADGRLSGAMRPTELRVSTDGAFAWFQQQERECRGMSDFNRPSDPRKNGVYRLPDLQLLATATGKLANESLGARVFTADGRALLLADGRLSLSDGTTFPQAALAREASITEAGRLLVYEDVEGNIRTLTTTPFGGGDSLVGRGRAPRISDDGATLVYITHPESRLRIVSLRSGGVTTRDPVLEAVISGDGEWVFAVDADDNLIRVPTAGGHIEILVKRVFRGIPWTAAALPQYCPLPCYNSAPHLKIQAGHIVLLRGVGFDDPGWMVSAQNIETPLRRLSADTVMFQLPATLRFSSTFPIRFLNHSHPVEFTAYVDGTFDRAVGCLGAVHVDGTPVDAARPARTGDVLSFFFTGLRPQTEPAPLDRFIEVPYRLGDAFETLWAGHAPGLLGVQQVNARVLRPLEPGVPLIPNASPSCETPPVIVER
jgi:hypothetical protein